jgi:hypothetical protein
MIGSLMAELQILSQGVLREVSEALHVTTVFLEMVHPKAGFPSLTTSSEASEA